MAGPDLRAAQFDLLLAPVDEVSLRFTHDGVDGTTLDWGMWVQSHGDPDPSAAVATAVLTPGVSETTGTLDVSALELGVDHLVVLRVGSGWAMGRCVRSRLTTVRQVHEVQLSLAEVGVDLTVVVSPGGDGRVEVGPTPPEDTSRLWARTDDHLEAFIDYRTYPDGDAPDTTPVGGLTIIDASELAPPGFYGPLTVVEGSLRTASSEGLGVVPVYALPPRTGPFRVTVGLADFTNRTGTPPENGSVITITDLGGNGPVLHVGYPEPDGDGGWVTTVLAGWDVNYEPVLGDPVFVPRLVGAGDRFSLGFDGTHWTARLNDQPIPGIDPWPHDDGIVTLDQLEFSSNPLHGQGGTWLAGTQWWALTDGDTDFDPDALTLHAHDGTGWVPVLDHLSEGQVGMVARRVAPAPAATPSTPEVGTGGLFLDVPINGAHVPSFQGHRLTTTLTVEPDQVWWMPFRVPVDTNVWRLAMVVVDEAVEEGATGTVYVCRARGNLHPNGGDVLFTVPGIGLDSAGDKFVPFGDHMLPAGEVLWAGFHSPVQVGIRAADVQLVGAWNAVAYGVRTTGADYSSGLPAAPVLQRWVGGVPKLCFEVRNYPT